MNNDLSSLVMRFTNDFHSWLPNCQITSLVSLDQKIDIHGDYSIYHTSREMFDPPRFPIILGA